MTNHIGKLKLWFNSPSIVKDVPGPINFNLAPIMF